MSSVGISRKAFPIDGQGAGGRRGAAGSDNGTLRTWLGICAAVGVACGLLGWTIGNAKREALEPKSAATMVRPTTARAWTPDVTNTPFGTVNDPSGAAAPVRAPVLPFTVIQRLASQEQPMALLERAGQRFVARGLAVHGDYLIQVERDHVLFTYLPSAARERLPLTATPSSAGAPAQPATALSTRQNRAAVPARALPAAQTMDEQAESD